MPDDPVNCFACGEQNTGDSRFCKFCGRPLVHVEKGPGVAQDPRNRLMLWLVLVLIVACVLFGALGVLTSRVGPFPGAASAARTVGAATRTVGAATRMGGAAVLF
ncbi:MAG: hypothetical protein ACYDAG_10955 [Chloroflexota bacterium]